MHIQKIAIIDIVRFYHCRLRVQRVTPPPFGAGNYQLTQVLPPIYRLQPDRFARHISSLVSVMPLCLRQERLALIDLFQLMAKQQPQVLSPCS